MRRPRGRSLYRRIYMHFLVLLVAVAFLSSWIFFGSWPGNVLSELSTRVTTFVAGQLAAAPNRAARRQLAIVLADELDLDVTLYARDGSVLAQRGVLLPPVNDLATIDRTTVSKRLGTWLIATPVRAPDESIVLECVPTTLTLRALPVHKVGALVVMLVLIALSVRPLARRISRPVEMLIAASRRFGNGDLSTRVKMPRFGPHHLEHMHGPEWHRRWHEKMQRKMEAKWQRHRFRHGDELFTLMHTWNDMAERIERQVGSQRELLANVSHELRSPLARVRVALALLPEDDKTRKRVADIEADLGELDTLIGEILETSRLEAGGLPTHDKTFEVSALYDEVIARATADPLTAPLHASIDPARPPLGELHGDCALLRRALFNLVENAAKYAAAPVTLGFEDRGADVAFTVTDHGPGVPEDERERVLQPFMRGDRAHTPGRGGVGLGLSFAARVASVHGGKLTLEDAPSGGLLVRIRLPRVRNPVGNGRQPA